MDGADRFRDRTVTLGGVTGQNLEIPSANPVNYHQAVNDPGGCEPLLADGKLFLPPADGPLPLVMVVPGSLGVGENHLAHAETLLEVGYAAFVLDPFGPRSVVSTVANQTHYSFAASAFDVLATLRVLAAHNAIDADPTTEWSSNGDGDDAWIEIELPTETHVTSLGLWTRTMGSSAQIFSFQVVTDSFEMDGPFTLSDAAGVHYFDTDLTGRRLRFEAVETSGGNTGVVDIEVYGEPAP